MQTAAVIMYMLVAILDIAASESSDLNFVSCFQPQNKFLKFKSKSICGSIPHIRAIPTKRCMSRHSTHLMSASENQNDIKPDILSALQSLDAELKDAIRREEYSAASKLKSQIEEMRRDASLGIFQNSLYLIVENYVCLWDAQRNESSQACCSATPNSTVLSATATPPPWRSSGPPASATASTWPHASTPATKPSPAMRPSWTVGAKSCRRAARTSARRTSRCVHRPSAHLSRVHPARVDPSHCGR
jgi:hypothetical protein